MKLVSDHRHSEPRFNERLQCDVHHVFYDFDARFGRLQMGEGSCCDMTAAIELFTQIDPECILIETFQEGDIPDTVYRLIRGKWQAFMP